MYNAILKGIGHFDRFFYYIKKYYRIYNFYIRNKQFLNQKILYINVREIKKRLGDKKMRNEYEMGTVADYISGLNNVKCVSIEEKEIEKQVEKYLLNVQRAKTNAKIVEALLA